MPRRAPLFKPVPVQLSGEAWTVKSGRVVLDGEECWGVTDFGNRVIKLDPSTKEEGNEREILLHEAFHVFFPQVDEEVIVAAAKEADALLDAMGM